MRDKIYNKNILGVDVIFAHFQDKFMYFYITNGDAKGNWLTANCTNEKECEEIFKVHEQLAESTIKLNQNGGE